MLSINRPSQFGSKCGAILALVLVVVLFVTPVVNAVTVTASYSTGGGGGSPPSPPPTPPPPPADTTPPVISGIAVTDITSSSARIIWTTNEVSTSVINYGLTSNYGTTTTVAGLVTSHSVTINDLSPTTTYNFRVQSADLSANVAVSLNQTFATLAPDTIPPIISNIVVSQITGTSAKISWETNEPATGKIDYGLTVSYGLGPVLLNTLNLSQNTILAGLSSETNYHFQITATDSANNITVSSDQTFRTRDVTAPIISGFAVSNITPTSATASWTTNELTSAELTFTAIGRTHSGVLQNTSLSTSHSFSLTSLLPNTIYKLTAKAVDAGSNQTVSSPIQFQTQPDIIPPANVRDLALTPGNGTITLSWTNPSDIDFAGIKVLRKVSGFPGSPFDGTVIFNGSASSHPDLNLTNGVTYYYGVFAYDTSDNFASGAIISGLPIAPGEILPPPPPPPSPGAEPAPSPVAPPEILVTPPLTTVASTTPMVIVEEKLEQPTESRVTLDDLKLLLANRTILVPQNQFSEVHSLPGSSLGVIVSPVVVTPLKSIIISLGGNTYLLRAEKDGTYQGDFILPAQIGLYPVKLLVSYADKKEELLEFNIAIDPFGSVAEKINGQIKRLPDVKVTLFEIIDGEKVQFDAAKFNQLNPVLTNQSGAYGFIVPAGTYIIRAELDSYRSFLSNKFEVKNFVVNRAIELLPIPKTVLESVPFATKVVAESITEFVNNPDVQKINNAVAPAITTVATVNTVAAVSVVNFGQYFWYLLTQPFILLRRRKYRKWGVVYDALKKLPVDLAVVRLYQQYLNPGEKMKRWRLIGTQVTDKQGRYLFLAKPGIYHIQAAKPGFRFPSNFLQNVKEDRGFADIYHGETFEVGEEKVLTHNIPLDSEAKSMAVRQFSWQELFKGFQNGVSFGGIALMGVSYTISPRLQNLLLLLGNLGLFLIFSRFARRRAGKNWGHISDSSSGKLLSGTIVRLFDQQFNKLVATTNTDAKGRYSFLAGSNSYYMIFDAVGYETYQTPVFDLGKTSEKIVAKDIKLTKLKN